MKRLGFSLVLATVSISLVCCGRPGESGGARRAASPRVLLIGIDGADLAIIDRLIGQGKLPTFARLEREGAFGLLRSQEPLLSPIVWTTIATGRTAQDHGVLDFIEIGADGQPTPIMSTRRRVPALWNILSDYKKSSGFVGWYASYPAEKVDGFEVSDRLAFHQVRSARASAGATYPEKLADDLRREFGEPVPDLAATKTRFLADPSSPLTADGEKRLEALARIFATSEFYRKILPPLAQKFRPDLLAVYFEGIDACGHLFMEDAAPKRPNVSDADFQSFSQTVDRYYEYQDEELSDLLRLEGPETVTLIVSDHGFKSGDLRPQTSGRADTGLAPLWHRLHGVVFVHGKSVRPGSRIERASIFDVTPTVLAVLSVPLSRELAGQPIVGAFLPGSLTAQASVQGYRPVPVRPKPPAAAADSEAVAKLMALGYLTGSARGLAHDADGRTVASYISEGVARTHTSDWEGAIRAFGKASQLDPKNINALAPAAAIYIRQGDLQKARELLNRAAAIDPNNYWVLIQEASLSLQTGSLSDAARTLDSAEKLDTRLPGVHLLRARLQRASGDPRAALDELKLAESLTDADSMRAEILLLRVGIDTDLGDYAGAETALTSAQPLAGPAQLAEARGELAFARHDGEGAEKSFRRAIEANPGSALLERRLGETLGATQKFEEAEGAFRRSIAKSKTPEEKESAYGDLALVFQRQQRAPEALAVLKESVGAVPGSNALWGMLGGAFGLTGDLDSAIQAYERSISLKPTPLACKTLAALLFERRKDSVRAVALWKQSLALDPNQPEVREFLRRYGSHAGVQMKKS